MKRRSTLVREVMGQGVDNTRFCRYLLAGARAAAKAAGVKLPKRITAMRVDKDWFFVEADGVKGEYALADNAYDAKAKYIYELIERAAPTPES